MKSKFRSSISDENLAPKLRCYKCKIYTRFQKLRKRNVVISVLFMLVTCGNNMLHVDVWGSIKYII